MIDKEDIRFEVRGQTFQRGQLIFQCQGVKDVVLHTKTDEEGYKVTQIAGRVRGSTRNYYEVRLSVDEEYSEIAETHCECKAFYSYSAPCKHCVALALQYIQIRDAGHAGLFSKSVLQTENLGGIKLTEPAMGRVLEYYRRKKEIPLLQPKELGQVKLEPVLHVNTEHAGLEFRIGNKKMYVLKSIKDLVRAVQNMENVSYGKELSFIHTMHAFTADSQKILRFILQQSERTDPSSSGSERLMLLTHGGFERFREIIGKTEFAGHVKGEREQNWRFVEEEPSRQAIIIGEEQGIHIEMSSICKYAGVNYVYYFKEGLIYQLDIEKEEELREFESYIDSWRGLSNYVSTEEIPIFVRNLLPVMKKNYRIETKNFNPALYEPLSPVFELYLDAPEKNRVTCDLVAVYGEDRYHVFTAAKNDYKRDYLKEYETGMLVSRYCNDYDEKNCLYTIVDDDEKMYEFITEGIPGFQKDFEVFISDRLKRLRVIREPKAAVGISLSGGLLEFTLDSIDLSMEQMVSLLSKYDVKKRFYRLKSGEFVNLQNKNLERLANLKKELQIPDLVMKQGAVSIPRYRALYLEEELKELKGIPTDRSKDFKALIRNMRATGRENHKLPRGLETVLRGYQKKGFLWLKTLKENEFGGILADDMGLGKTLQVIAFLLSEYQTREAEPTRTLIICPASLVFNWKSECTQFAPELPVTMIVGSAEERKSLIEAAGERDILITSYDLLKRDIDSYRKIMFSNEIIDEAQYIKNHATQASRAVKKIHAGYRIALTGTPVENRLSELWSIFDYLMPGYLYSYQRFRREIEIPVVQNKGEDALLHLHKMIRPFVLRRLKKDVLKDLPEKLEKNLYAGMEGEQRKIYQAHVRRLQMTLSMQSGEEFEKSKMLILAELTKLRQICCDPALLLEGYDQGSAKLDLCLELVENAVEGGHKILLFSQFTTMLDRICQGLTEKKISHYLLTGSTSKEERMRMVQAFHEDDTSVFCISLKAGGTGLNLTAADIVIHYDPWWNTAVQNQATDRAHRIGQKNKVMVYRLIAKDTIEEKIVQLQEKKQQLADQVLGGEGMQGTAFTKEELLDILEF